MISTQNYCIGGRHYSQTVNRQVYENLNPKTQKAAKTQSRLLVMFVVKTIKVLFKRTEKIWKTFIKPGLKISTPNI